MTSAELIPFNPLDKKNLGASVAEALVSQPVHPLGTVAPFKGTGIYAIYYHDEFGEYGRVSTPNRANRSSPAIPIYVGKAVPEGARRGRALDSPTNSKALFRRLSEHAESVAAVPSLSIDDFSCRYLIVDEIWIPLGESLMIAKFSPLWNVLIEGFGNHDPGGGRYGGLKPRWDLIHPGRIWASRCKERPESREDVLREIKTYLDSVTLPESPHFLGRAD